ncbi:hypothetical protein GCM10027051_15820 [Niabella terrae]
MNWIKKKFDQLSARLNGDSEPAISEAPNSTGQVQQAAAPTPVSGGQPDRLENIETLKELTIGAITQSVRLLGYSNTVVSGLIFHSRYAPQAVENTGMLALLRDQGFIKSIQRDFKAKGIRYQPGLLLDIVHESGRLETLTRITDGLAIEVRVQGDANNWKKARLVATEGLTWEPEYLLEPVDGRSYFVGRCRDPKIENGPKIHNDIAFVGIEEKNEPRYEVNNYISRSNAQIVFDKELGAFKIYRSRFLNNPANKIKIYNTGQQDFAGVSLNNAQVAHVLKNGDSICFNDKIVLEFYLID